MAVSSGEKVDIARIREAAASFHAEVAEVLGLSDNDHKRAEAITRCVGLAALVDQHTQGGQPPSGSFEIRLYAEGEGSLPSWTLDPGPGTWTDQQFLELFVSGINSTER